MPEIPAAPALIVFGLRLSAGSTALLGSALLWLALTAAVALLGFSLAGAALLGLAGVALHWLADLWHQAGHALAARRTGHPMAGVRLWGVLSASVYPPDEPALPRGVHVWRALGGPLASALLSALALIPPATLPAAGGLWWLALFFLLDNLLTFALGALLPLGFTDGSTILHWYRHREAKNP